VGYSVADTVKAFDPELDDGGVLMMGKCMMKCVCPKLGLSRWFKPGRGGGSVFARQKSIPRSERNVCHHVVVIDGMAMPTMPRLSSVAILLGTITCV